LLGVCGGGGRGVSLKVPSSRLSRKPGRRALGGTRGKEFDHQEKKGSIKAGELAYLMKTKF